MRSARPHTLEKFKHVMQEVYGEFTDKYTWKPKPYADNKSRYLWTDAFGVCNYITLYCETKEQQYLDQADILIRDVHDTLGKDRKLQNRLDGATDQDPLKGGLRIGKVDPEGTRDGDGQYFHYLTKWMYCLNRMAVVKQDDKYNNWAIQLAKAVHNSFVIDQDKPRPRMFWKMSIDLKRPAVNSEGNLDPFDGYITYRLLNDYAKNGVLDREIQTLEKIVSKKFPYYSSNDALDLGECLWIGHWYLDEDWSESISKTSIRALDNLYLQGEFDMPIRYRLAFREFGTTIGVQVNPVATKSWQERAQALNQFWEPNIYSRDKDITPVMYCTSLIPGAFQKGYIETKMA